MRLLYHMLNPLCIPEKSFVNSLYFFMLLDFVCQYFMDFCTHGHKDIDLSYDNSFLIHLRVMWGFPGSSAGNESTCSGGETLV